MVTERGANSKARKIIQEEGIIQEGVGQEGKTTILMSEAAPKKGKNDEVQRVT